MRNPLFLIALLLLTVLIATYVLVDSGGEAPPGQVPPAAPPPAAPAAAKPAVEREDAAPRTELEGAEDKSDEPEVATVELRGRVLDPSGGPLRGVPVRQVGREAVLCESGDGGEFAIRIAAGSAPRLEARGNGYAPLVESAVQESNVTLEHVLVAAPALDLAGVVVDATGGPIAGATVSVRIPESVLLRFPLPLEMTWPVMSSARTGDDGRFALDQAPAPRGGVVRARAEGFAQSQTPVPAYARSDLYLVLAEATEEAGARITGFVLEADRSPAAGASVRFGFEEVRTDRSGAFALGLPRNPDPEMPLVAGKAGAAMAIAPAFGEVVRGAAPDAPEPVTLVLGEKSRDIAGRVVDAQGQPLRGWMVSLVDGTHVTRGRFPPIIAEGYPHRSKAVGTDSDGAFRIADLLPRAYVIRAYERSTLRAVLSDPIPAGSESVELVVPDGLTQAIQGTVVSRRGVPLANVQVTPGMYTHKTQSGSAWESGKGTITGEDGGFEFAAFPRAHVHLNVSGEGVVPNQFEVGPDDDVTALRFVVAQRCHFRVTVTGADLAGLNIELRDASERSLQIYKFRAGGWSSQSVQQLEDGVSPLCAASEDASELWVRRSGELEPVVRQPIGLVAGEVSELRVALP